MAFDAARELGWEYLHINPSISNFSINPLQLLPDGTDPSSLQFAFARMGSAAPAECLTYYHLVEQSGLQCFNSPQDLINLRDKAWCMGALAQANVPIPKTVTTADKETSFEEVEAKLGPLPWVAKSRFGEKGMGMLLVESKRSFRSAFDLLLGTNSYIFLQEYVGKRVATDIRVFMLNGNPLGAMERTGPEGDFRSNLALGGKCIQVEIKPEIAKIATAAVNALNLPVAGVDLLEGEDGFLVVEVNSCPGLEGISEALGRNVGVDVLKELSRIATEAAEVCILSYLPVPE